MRISISSKFFAVLLLFFQVALGKIVTTDSLTDIEKLLDNADKQSLVIFDCDDVLIRQTDATCSPEGWKVLSGYLAAVSKKSPELGQKLTRTIWETAPQTLVDSDMPRLVAQLQKRGIKVMVLTKMANKPLDGTTSADLRVDELFRFGFDFSKMWTNLQPKFFGLDWKSPYYKSGIVFSEPGGKGDALKSFLKYAKLKPSKIFFIDDKVENLKSVEHAFAKDRVRMTCIEYTASKKLSRKFEFSNVRLQVQLHLLNEEGKWYSDEEVEKRAAEKLKEGKC